MFSTTGLALDSRFQLSSYYSLVGIKRPLGCSLTYALRIYIGISIIATCYLLQNTSVENVETSWQKAGRFHHACISKLIYSPPSAFERGDQQTEASLLLLHSLFRCQPHQTIITKILRLNIGRANPSITIICYRGDTSCVCALPLYTVDLILITI